MRTVKSLIRLGSRCPSWSESSLHVQFMLLVLSCCSSFQDKYRIFIQCPICLDFYGNFCSIKRWSCCIIRINGCEVWIENSIMRVTVWHHEACRVMPNSYPEALNFQFAPDNHYRFFFLHYLPSTVELKLGYALLYQFYTEIFLIKK